MYPFPPFDLILIALVSVYAQAVWRGVVPLPRARYNGKPINTTIKWDRRAIEVMKMNDGSDHSFGPEALFFYRVGNG